MPLQLRLPEGVHLRPSTESDDAFLERLYASTREELKALGPAAGPLIRMQYQAKNQGYQQQYPHACEFVIEKLDEAIGQIRLDIEKDQVRVIELAFLPEQRNRGWGKAVLGALQGYAAQIQAAIVLTVNRDNLMAKSLYSALGFRSCATEPPNERMLWRPDKTVYPRKPPQIFGN